MVHLTIYVGKDRVTIWNHGLIFTWTKPGGFGRKISQKWLRPRSVIPLICGKLLLTSCMKPMERIVPKQCRFGSLVCGTLCRAKCIVIILSPKTKTNCFNSCCNERQLKRGRMCWEKTCSYPNVIAPVWKSTMSVSSIIKRLKRLDSYCHLLHNSGPTRWSG